MTGLIAFLIIELALGSFYAIKKGELLAPWTLFSTITTDFDPENPLCRWADSTKLHPLYFFNYKKNGHCNQFNMTTNDLGFVSPPFNFDDRENYYVVLFLGGSVTEGLFFQEYFKRQIENKLNENFKSPNGKPFKLVSFAIAGGQQPMQFNIYSYFSEFVDAVVSLEGYNERNNFKLHQHFAYPPALWDQKVGEARQRGIKILIRRMGFAFSKILQQLKIAKYSYILFTIADFSVPKKNLELDFYEAPFKPYPKEWSDEKKNEINIKIYKSYLKGMATLAESKKQKYAFLLQPVPAFKESLTDQDRRVIGKDMDKELIGNLYEKLLSLKEEGLNIVDMRSSLDNYRKDIYIDHIHTNHSGKVVLGEAIYKELIKTWGLEKK